MSIIPGNAQHIGARAEQQDAFGFSDIADKAFTRHGGVLAVVADGMGGMANGREASTLAVRAMLAAYALKTPAEPISAALYRAITEANRAVHDFAHLQGKAGGVGTTLIATVLHGEELHWIAVGDSRIYMVRDGHGTQINIDHVYARELRLRAARGEISAEQVHNHPEREALTSFLGDREIAEIDRSTVPLLLRAGDRLVLCTDGLYRAVPENELAAIAAQGSSSAAAEALVARALASRIPNQDNATVALLTVPKAPGTRKMLSLVAGSAAAVLVAAGAALYALLPSPEPTVPPVSAASKGGAVSSSPAAPDGEVTDNTIQQRLLDQGKEQNQEAVKPQAKEPAAGQAGNAEPSKAAKDKAAKERAAKEAQDQAAKEAKAKAAKEAKERAAKEAKAKAKTTPAGADASPQKPIPPPAPKPTEEGGSAGERQ